MDNLKTWVNRNLQGDPVIWFVVFCLSVISILVVYSATGTLAYKMMSGNTEHYLMKHSFYMCLGLAAMWAAHKIDYRYYARLSLFALILSVPLLIFSWRFGTSLNDASRWLSIPIIGVTFQPSDLAKFALISYLASFLAKRQNHIEEIREYIIPMLAWCGIICGLILMSNMSTGLLMLVTCFLLMFIARVPMKYLMMLVMVGVLVIALALAFGQRGKTAINRIKRFTDAKEVPFQAQQGYIAIATGGAFGKGPGNSTQRNFLPHPYSDFIYAIIIEEYGLFGGAVVLGLFLLLLYRGMHAVANSERAFGGLLSAGLSFSLVFQSMINMGVAVGLGPITGLPLPMLSMGGTSLLFTGISIGIILSVSKGEGKEFGPDNELVNN